jgi:DNA-directed RNA polymerase subunit K/omega
MRSIARRAHGLRSGADVAAVVERELVCQPVDMGLRPTLPDLLR